MTTTHVALSWDYDEYFQPVGTPTRHPVIFEADKYVENLHVERHPFFSVAMRSTEALELWVTQELVVTNPFSQLVLRAASLFNNVHLRAAVTEVAVGEHGRVKNGNAERSHPWLLHLLRESLSIPPAQVYPYEETEEFIEGLSNDCRSPIEAVAAIGVGNERLIIPEYEAIKRCFAECRPSADYRAFLDANIKEDVTHFNLMYDVAARLLTMGAEPNLYRDAAIRAVDRRYHYYDRLYKRVSNL
jgi:hypothetical protein